MAAIVGYDELIRRLRELQRAARNAKPALDEGADVALDSIDQSFEAGGRPAWAPHALATLAGRMGPHRLLIAEGNLRGSFRKKVGRQQASIFPTDWKAIFHEEGTQRNGAEHIPARPFMHLQDRDVTTIGRNFGEYLFP